MKIILDEKQLKSLVRLLKEQEEEDYYKISPDDYIKLMKVGYYHPNVTRIRKFKDKPLYITGNLNISNLPMTDLGNVIYIDGNLNMSYTNISKIDDSIVKGYITDYGSTRDKIRIREEERKKMLDADERREEGLWDLNNPDIDEIGLMANALFNYLVSEGKLDEMDEETKENLDIKMKELDELNIRYENEESDELYDEISSLEEEIDDIIGEYSDVYSIIPTGNYYYMKNFEIVGRRDEEYVVGVWDDAYKSAVEYEEQLIEDVGVENLSDWLISNNINYDDVESEMIEYYENEIYDYPEGYFNSDDFELTEEQEERIEELQNYIDRLEEIKNEIEDKIDNSNDEYEITKLENKIEEIESNIENAQDEIDSIEPDTEPTDGMVMEKARDMVDDIDDKISWLKEHSFELNYYVDMNGVAEDIINQDGIEILSSYGTYDEETIRTSDGKKYDFIVMRIN